MTTLRKFSWGRMRKLVFAFVWIICMRENVKEFEQKKKQEKGVRTKKKQEKELKMFGVVTV